MPPTAAPSMAAIGILQGEPVLVDFINNFLVQSIIVMGLCAVLGALGSYVKQPKVRY